MAVPFIQLGQCGNQIGANFYDIMFNEGLKASQGHQGLLSQFFQTYEKGKNTAKSILIDMEPKVVNKNLSLNKKWKYKKQFSFVQEEGSGNNWAFGCYVHGPRVRDRIEEIINKFCEGEDYINSFVQIQSLAGGTGSGMGTFIIQLLNQMFPKTPKFAICVMPHLSGQVILQSYNATLSVGTIYKQADGIFIIENDEVSDISTKNLKIQKTSLNDINEIIGRTIASVFFPAINKNVNVVHSIEQNAINYGVDFVDNLFFDNRFKLSSLKTAPHGPKNSQVFNFDSWQAVYNDILYKKKHNSIGNMMIGRGSDHPTSFNGIQSSIFDKHAFYGYNRSITYLDNGPMFMDAFQKILERGYCMMKQKAYIYQYQKYGLQRQQLLNCFGVVESVQQNYKHLLKN